MSSNMSDALLKRKNKKAKNKKKAKGGVDISTLTLAQFMTKAQECLDICNPEAAYNYVDYAVQKFKPEDPETLQFCADVYIDGQNFEEGKSLLQKAIKVDPEKGHGKYFSLAQLLAGKDALQLYIKGTEILQNTIKLRTEARSSAKLNKTTNDKLSDRLSDMEVTEKPNGNLQSNLQKEIKITQNGEPEIEVQGAEAVQNNLKEDKIENLSSNLTQEIESLKKELSLAFCSLSELHTIPDLCDEDDAEEKCVSYIQKALDAAEIPDAYYYQANYHLIKGDMDAAKASILKSVSLWLPKYREIDEGIANEAGLSVEAAETLDLTTQFRNQTAKVLIEVGEMELANEVLEGVMGEDDESAEVWYMIGFNLSLNGDDTHKPSAKYHLKKALELHTESGEAEDEMIEHIKEMLAEMKEVETEDEDDEETIEEEELDGMDVDESMEAGPSGL